jgi:hypothetical protein
VGNEEVEVDEAAQLILNLEKRWEDPYVDFKRQLSLRSVQDRAEFIKDILGLANTQGQSRRFLLVGWDDRTRTVLPPGVGRRPKRDQLQQVLNAYSDPPPHITYETYKWRGALVGILEVIREPIRVPHKVSRKLGKREVGEVFVRHGTITEAPTPRELEALNEEGLNARLREGADELIRPDRTSLRFTPLGLSTSGVLTPRAAAAFQDQTIALDLSDSVPDRTRKLFKRLQTIHRLGIWAYDMYTVADGYAIQVLEHAFTERLLGYYGNHIPIVGLRSSDHDVRAESFQELLGSRGKGRWRLKSLKMPGKTMPFDGTLEGLFAWARNEGLLRGQRSRRFDIVLPRILRRMRPLEYMVHMPVDSSRSVRLTGEFINQLWGAPTPAGEIFPAPIPRRTLVLGWSPRGDSMGTFLPEQLADQTDRSDWRFIVVLGVDTAGALQDFHSDFECTPLPVRLLRGEGSWQETQDWLSHEPQPRDTVDVLDRYFVVNLRDSSPPRQVGQLAALTGARRTGRWFLLQADFPLDAFAHIRAHQQGRPDHKLLGICNTCWVDGKAKGSWNQILAAASSLGLDTRPVPASGIEVPMRLFWR